MDQLKLYKSKIGKSKMTSGNAYRIRVINALNGKQFSFVYNDNYLNESTDEQMLYAVVLDYQVYNECRDADDLSSMYGYDETESRKIYKTLARNAQKVKECLTPEQIEEILKLDC